MIRKKITIATLIFLGLFFLGFIYQSNITLPSQIGFGVTFSQMHTQTLGLNWKETYVAILQDLGAKQIKLHTQWDFVEGRKDAYYFEDIDWQLEKAREYDAKVIYVVGMKTGRWPECHLPSWAAGISKASQQEEILEYITQVVQRYKNHPALLAWQAENEALFRFGRCPWYDKEFLKREVALIKSLDLNHPVIISDSGEQSFWTEAANIGDIVGTTLYRKVWARASDNLGVYFTFPIPAQWYGLKARYIQDRFHKKVMNVELQAEPWVKEVYYNVPLAEQEKSMNLEQFKRNIEYAKQTGLDIFYLWGVEWQYWLKEKHHKPEIWEESKKLFKKF